MNQEQIRVINAIRAALAHKDDAHMASDMRNLQSDFNQAFPVTADIDSA